MAPSALASSDAPTPGSAAAPMPVNVDADDSADGPGKTGQSRRSDSVPRQVPMLRQSRGAGADHRRCPTAPTPDESRCSDAPTARGFENRTCGETLRDRCGVRVIGCAAPGFLRRRSCVSLSKEGFVVHTPSFWYKIEQTFDRLRCEAYAGVRPCRSRCESFPSRTRRRVPSGSVPSVSNGAAAPRESTHYRRGAVWRKRLRGSFWESIRVLPTRAGA